MTDVQDMTEAEYRVFNLRRFAASKFRDAALGEFAELVPLGELDSCPEMRVASFFIDPPQPHDAEYLAGFHAVRASTGRGQ